MNFLIKKKNKFFSRKGFSILEITVAISIIAVGFLGVSSLVIQNIQVQNINKNVLIASQLAQEGLELIRNQRDRNWMAGSSFDSGIEGGASYVEYKIDYLNPASADNVDQELKINIDGFFQYASGDDSGFKRVVEIKNNTTNLDVKCTVEWQDRGDTRDYVAQMFLYDWR